MKLMRKYTFVCLATATLILSGLGTWFILKSQSSEFGSVASDISSFIPYYFESDTVEGFDLVNDSVSYDGNVLVFTMQNDNGKTLVFTEQSTPNGFDSGSLRGDKEFKTPYGQAYVTDGQARTTGTLFTDDKTWVLINAPQPIGGDTMQKLLSDLRRVTR